MEAEQYNFVMMIDDDETTLQIHKMVIRKESLSDYFMVESNAQNALSTLQQLYMHNSSSFPKYILVDFNMPTMDGIEFIESFIEKFSDKKNHTQLLMISSSVSKKDQQRIENHSSIDDFMIKPIQKDFLMSLIKNQR